MSRRIDVLGIFVAVFMGGAVVLAIVLLIQHEVGDRIDRAAYERCVAAIPGYLDAQEILYMENECQIGLAP